MNDEGELRFTVNQTASVNTAIRVALGLPPEHYTVEQFLGALSDEITQLKGEGWSDDEIASLIREATGEPLGTEAFTRLTTGAGAS